jgi:hypothetical protein
MHAYNYARIAVSLALVLAGTARAAVTYVGEDNTTDSQWRTPSAAKPNDLDGDNVYGTAGYWLAWGKLTAGEANYIGYSEVNLATSTRALTSMPAWWTGVTLTNPPVNGWRGDGGNFGNLDKVAANATGWAGAPVLKNGGSGPMGLLLKRTASPAFRLTLIVGNSQEAPVWRYGEGVTVDDGSGVVVRGMDDPVFGSATGKTTYQSWDISAGSSDVFILLDMDNPTTGGATYTRITGIAVDTVAAVPPSVSSPPVGGDYLAGADVSLSGVVQGTAPRYQWYKNGSPVGDATNAVLRFPAIALSDAGSYRFVASNPAGNATSADAVVSVTTSIPPGQVAYSAAVTAQSSLVSYYPFNLQNARDALGANHGTIVGGLTFAPSYFGGATKSAYFSGGQIDYGTVDAFQFADGTGTVELWFRCGWIGPTAASADVYLFACRDDANGENYSVAVNSARTVIRLRSGAEQLDFPAALGNTWHHLGVVFDAGNVTVLLDGVPSTQPFSPSGAVASFQVGSPIPTDGGNNRWIGDIDEVAVYADALSTEVIQAHNALSPIPPSLNSQPSSQGAFVGSPILLAVEASGPALAYQWYREGALLPGATGNTFTRDSVVPADAGSYFVVVTNQNLAVTSTVATVTVWTPNVAAYEATVRAESGLLSFYTFDTDTQDSMIVNDVKGPNLGTVNGAQAYEPGLGGGANRAFFFDGFSWITLGSVPDLAFADGIGSVELLIRNDRPVNSGVNACMVSYRQDPDTRYSFFAMSPLTSYADWNGSALLQAGTGLVPPTSWHHIAWVFSAGTTPTTEVYFDGALVGSSANHGPGGGDPTVASAQLGAPGPGGTGEMWVGALDEVAFYSTALSASTVAQHFADLTGTSLNPPTLTIATSGSDATISWTGAAGSWVLEKADAVSGGTWNMVGSSNPVTVPINGHQGFFRLRKF